MAFTPFMEYGIAHDLITQIETEHLEIERRLKVINELKEQLREVIEVGGVRSLDKLSTISVPSQVAKDPSPKTEVTERENRAPVRVTLGDMVREILIEAGKPLKHTEIRDALKGRQYRNSTDDPYKTLGVRLHRLQKRGVKGIGKGYFDLTDEWKAKLKQKRR